MFFSIVRFNLFLPSQPPGISITSSIGSSGKKSRRTLALQYYERNWTSSHGWPFPAFPKRCCQSHWHKGICSTPRSCDNLGVVPCAMFSKVYYIQKVQKTDICSGRVASADNEHARCKYILFPGLRLTSLKTTQNFMSFEEGIAKTSSGFKFSPKMHCKCSDCRVALLNAWLILQNNLLDKCFSHANTSTTLLII